MNKNNTKNALIVLSFILLAVNLFSIQSMKRELKDDYSRLESNLQNSIRNIQHETQDLYRNVEELLKKEQSIFSESSVDLKLQGSKIAVTMRAVPKEIKNNEKLIARIIANGEVHEQETDENYQAVIIVDMAETLKPTFIIKSDIGLRQESLDELYSSEVFTTRVFGQWNHDEGQLKDSMILDLWIMPNESELPFTANDIEKAEFIITDNGTMKEQNSSQGYSSNRSSNIAIPIDGDVEDYFNQLNGDIVTATKLSGKDKFELGYRADFSGYSSRRDGISYEIYFTLITKDGIQYITAYNPVASFSFSNDGGSSSSGDEILRPIFK